MSWPVHRSSVAAAAAVTVASTAYLAYGCATVQHQLDATGRAGCVDPNVCWPTGSAMNAIGGMQLIAAFVPVLLGLILGVPLFSRRPAPAGSGRRWTVTRLVVAMAVGGVCTAAVALPYRLIAARYTLLANDRYELLEMLHLNHPGYMVMQTVFMVAVSGVLGLVNGSVWRTLAGAVIWWPIGIALAYLGVLLLSFPLALLHLTPGRTVEYATSDQLYWTSDISFADAYGYAAMVALLGYALVAVLIGRRVAPRFPAH